MSRQVTRGLGAWIKRALNLFCDCARHSGARSRHGPACRARPETSRSTHPGKLFPSRADQSRHEQTLPTGNLQRREPQRDETPGDRPVNSLGPIRVERRRGECLSPGINAAKNQIYVTWKQNLVVIDGDTGAQRTLAMPLGAFGIINGLAINQLTNKIYATSVGPPTIIFLIDGETLTVWRHFGSAHGASGEQACRERK